MSGTNKLEIVLLSLIELAILLFHDPEIPLNLEGTHAMENYAHQSNE